MVIDVLPLMLLLITPPLVLHSLPDPRALLPLILSFLLEPEFPWAMLGNVKGTGVYVVRIFWTQDTIPSALLGRGPYMGTRRVLEHAAFYGKAKNPFQQCKGSVSADWRSTLGDTVNDRYDFGTCDINHAYGADARDDVLVEYSSAFGVGAFAGYCPAVHVHLGKRGICHFSPTLMPVFGLLLRIAALGTKAFVPKIALTYFLEGHGRISADGDSPKSRSCAVPIRERFGASGAATRGGVDLQDKVGVARDRQFTGLGSRLGCFDGFIIQFDLHGSLR